MGEGAALGEAWVGEGAAQGEGRGWGEGGTHKKGVRASERGRASESLRLRTCSTGKMPLRTIWPQGEWVGVPGCEPMRGCSRHFQAGQRHTCASLSRESLAKEIFCTMAATSAHMPSSPPSTSCWNVGIAS